jgi:hypothetical protein
MAARKKRGDRTEKIPERSETDHEENEIGTGTATGTRTRTAAGTRTRKPDGTAPALSGVTSGNPSNTSEWYWLALRNHGLYQQVKITLWVDETQSSRAQA